MANHWEKPGFEVVMLGAECTAYSGAQIAREEPVLGLATNENSSRSNHLLDQDRPVLEVELSANSSGS
jgi:hypothetical protein